MSDFPAESLAQDGASDGASDENDAWSFRVQVPEDSPFFEGHFPGKPILPGVAQLALCSQLIRAALGEGAQLIGIRTLRYKSPALPGDVLEVGLRRVARQGELAVAIRRGDDDIASGALLIQEGPEA